MKKVLVAALALAIVAPVFAQEEEPQGPPPAAVAAHNRVVAFLDLGEEQVDAWNEIYRIHREAERPLREDVRSLEAALKDLVASEDPDPAEVGALVLEIAELREALREVHLIYHEDFVALLDEEQVGRLGFIARADKVQPIIPAFKLFELIPKR